MNREIMEMVNDFTDEKYASFNFKRKNNVLTITKIPLPKYEIANQIIQQYNSDAIEFLHTNHFNSRVAICLYYDRETGKVNVGYAITPLESSCTARVAEAVALLDAVGEEVPGELLR